MCLFVACVCLFHVVDRAFVLPCLFFLFLLCVLLLLLFCVCYVFVCVLLLVCSSTAAKRPDMGKRLLCVLYCFFVCVWLCLSYIGIRLFIWFKVLCVLCVCCIPFWLSSFRGVVLLLFDVVVALLFCVCSVFVCLCCCLYVPLQLQNAPTWETYFFVLSIGVLCVAVLVLCW